jgi:hypothetical protein
VHRDGSHFPTCTTGNAARAPASGLSHLEGSPVASHTDNDFLPRNTSFGDHGQRLLGLCQVDLAAQAVTSSASLSGITVLRIPLTVEIIGHVDYIIYSLANFLNRELLQVLV